MRLPTLARLSLLVAVSLIGVAAETITPHFSSGFHPGGEQAGNNWVNDQKGFANRPGGNLKITILSEGVRYGGAQLALTGKFLDRTEGCIVSVYTMGTTINEPNVTVGFLPSAEYECNLSIEGRQYFINTVTIDGKDTSLTIRLTVDAERTIAGFVSGIPVWASESPIIFQGPYGASINPEGRFSLKSRAEEATPLTVSCRMLRNKGNMFSLVKVMFPTEISKGQDGTLSVKIPILTKTESPVVMVKVAFSPALAGKGLDPVLKNTGVDLVRNSDVLRFHSNPGPDGMVGFYDVPDGEYTVDITKGAMGLPFESKLQRLKITGGKPVPSDLTIVIE